MKQIIFPRIFIQTNDWCVEEDQYDFVESLIMAICDGTY